MFSYQVVVAFVVFMAGLLFLFSYVKRGMRLVRKAIFAWSNNKLLSVHMKVFTAPKEKLFSCLGEMAFKLERPLKIVEIGAGPGANFKFLPENTEVVCVEPNEYAKKYLLANAKKFPEVKVKEFHVGVAEDMSFVASDSVDAVICTHVLCSVTDVDQTLREILRILKKGGKLLFLEHIEAVAGSSSHFWQHFFKHPWHFIAKHGSPTRRTDVSIKNAGFEKTNIEIFDANYSQAPTVLKPLYKLSRRQCVGVAIK